MRRAYAIFWIPFVFSIGSFSWALLIAGLGLLAAVILAPAIQDVKEAQATRNDYRASLELLDQKIALQERFVQAATRDPVLMERLASRQLNLNRPDQDLLILDPAFLQRDRSIQSLLAESLVVVEPQPVPPLNPLLALALSPALRSVMVSIACLAIALSFFLGVKYQRH